MKIKNSIDNYLSFIVMLKNRMKFNTKLSGICCTKTGAVNIIRIYAYTPLF